MTILDDRAAKAIQEAMDARVRALSANHPTTHMAEVIEIDQAGVTWVHIFGGADRTPAIRSLAKVKKGDLVTVTIEDGVVTINGSSSNPAASVEYVEAADYAVAEYAKQAMAAVLGDVLQVKEAIIGRATVEELTAVEATVQTLTASYANLNEIVAGKATIVDLDAATARISQLEADDVTINGKITAAEGRIGTIESDYLKTTDMDAEVARVGTLLTGYAEADLANVNNAWIENGVIKDAAITNEMVGSLSANKLTAGTINGANINVTNLNADNITTGTINGQRIGAGSLSLDKLSEDVYTESEVDSIVDGLNDRIDGAIETHTGATVPTLNNSPASSWNTTDLKDEHIGDVYYVVNSQSQQNGYCYRFTKTGNTYSWQLIKDSDVTAALSRLETAEGKITTFDSDISTLKTDTGELKTKTQTLETSLGDKVDTSTFNELSSTVDENFSTITSMSTVLTNNGLTSSTNITNTVNTVSQTASSNSSVISQLASTLGTNADGTTKAGDIVHRTSAVEQDLDTFKTTVSSTYASKDSVEAAQADATKALNRQVAYSATSATGASTAAKVATCANFPTLAAGTTVTVRFSAANTSTGAITLNVNSTGAKTIYVNGATTAAGNQMLWAANANITFTYDGTYWRVVSEPRTWYGTCSTAAATTAKTATINEIVVCKGTVVKLNMTYENTSTSATMNLTSTGAKNLYYGTTTTRPTTANGYGWGAASTATFVFDGQYWRVGDTSVLSRLIQAESTISSHTTSINQNAEAIALKANSSEVYTKAQTDGLISTEVTNRNAAITAKASEISASVEETYATKTALSDGIDDAKDYTDSEISSAKAEIKVTTDGISTEVAKKTDKATIISTIRQSAETVKIKASQVEIDGTAIFNSISSDVDSAITSKGYQTSSQVESAITSKGYATTGQVATAKSEAISSANSTTDTKLANYSTTTQMNTAISTAVDNIDVGGRNLLKGRTTSSWTTNGLTFEYDASTHISHIYGTNTKTDAVWTQSNFYMPSLLTDELIPGEEYTLTCYDLGGFFDSDLYVQLNTYITTGSQVGDWSVGKARHNPSHTNTVRENHDHHDGWANLFMGVPTTVRDVDAKVRFKFEKGNVSTDYSPAPEDLAPASAGVYYATCSTAAETAVKVATTEQPGFTLVPGAMVNVKFTVTNSAAVANLKLNVDGTGDKPIKYIYNNLLNDLPAVGYLLANNVYTFRYDGTNWVAQLMYNTDTQSRTRWQNVILAAAAITSGHIICGTASGYKDIAASVTFDLSYPLLYCATTKAAGGTSDNNFLQINGIKITNNGTVTSAANYKTVYLVGTVSGNTFTVKASPFMTTVEPTSEDGFFYIPLGVFYNSTTNIYFNSTKDLYAYIDGKFRQVTPTEVIAEQYIYCQSDSIVNIPTAPTEWVTEIGESVSDDDLTKPNLLDKVPKAYNKAGYNAYDLSLSDSLVAETEYTLYLFDVDVAHSGKNTDTLGVMVYYNGGNISFGGWKGATYFTDGHADMLRLTFTPHESAIATTSGGNVAAGQNMSHSTASITPPFIRLYNSVPSASGTMSMKVGSWQMFVGSPASTPIWSTKPPTYRSMYPVTFVAKQRKRLDGTIVCTQPVMDDTSTIIDGGHIVTGTIDAARVNVLNLNADNITSGTLDASRIDAEHIVVSIGNVNGLAQSLDSKALSSDLDNLTNTVSSNEQAASAAIAALGAQTAETDAEHDARIEAIEMHVNITSVGEGTSAQPAIIMNAEGTETANMSMVLTNTELSFTDHNEKVAWVSNRKMYNTELEVTGQATFGNFAYVPMADGSLAFKWVG